MAQAHSRQPSATSKLIRHTKSTFSLGYVFLIVTICAVFFALLEISPLLAVMTTLVVVPALMRASWIEDRMRRFGVSLSWNQRIRYYLTSMGIMVLIAWITVCAFMTVSLLFGVGGWLLSVMLGSMDNSGDAIVVGTAGGMVWGFAAAILAFGLSLIETWVPAPLKKLEMKNNAVSATQSV